MAHKVAQPVRRDSIHVLRRDRDGKWWAGPWKWTGRTFVSNPAHRWATRSERAMRARVEDEGFTGVTIVRVDR